ncbi:MAG: hypothetical protein HC828_01900 [Blastochloris sp.]|nr:hypothetical protein [Blastochloris sp.]
MTVTESVPHLTPVLAVIDHHGETIRTTTGASLYEVFAGPHAGYRSDYSDLQCLCRGIEVYSHELAVCSDTGTLWLWGTEARWMDTGVPLAHFRLDLAGEVRNVLAGFSTILAWLGRHLEIAKGERAADLVRQLALVAQARDLLLALIPRSGGASSEPR